MYITVAIPVQNILYFYYALSFGSFQNFEKRSFSLEILNNSWWRWITRIVLSLHHSRPDYIASNQIWNYFAKLIFFSFLFSSSGWTIGINWNDEWLIGHTSIRTHTHINTQKQINIHNILFYYEKFK